MNLRDIYQEFIFEDYMINYTNDGIVVTYKYRINDYIFNPTVTISNKDITKEDIDKEFVDYLFFNFGIINAINYYKLTCSKKFIIKCGYLDEYQKEFFKKLFYNGLGELLYKNNLNISYEDFLEIETINKEYSFSIPNTFNGNLIPIGGGKDSIVTLELLKSEKDINSCFLYKRNIYPEDKASLNTIYTAGYKNEDILSFNVTLDSLMLELNKQGFLNGHVPFSSSLAFATYIIAYLNNKKYIILSNEASANEGNVKGSSINHQYSKSYEFEKDFREYTEKYFTKDIEYFSMLRCWNEFRIVKEFVKHPEYLDVFRSCNIGMKENKWCGDCSKCLYVYIMLYPFIDNKKLIEIFGKNMLDDEKYKDMLLGLMNDNYDKPFECVGTKEEVNYALSLGVKKDGDLPLLLKFYKENYYTENQNSNIENYFNKENFINDKFLKMMGYDINER